MAYVFDNFQRLNGALGGSWSTPTVPAHTPGTGSIVILNNGYAPTVAAGASMCMSVWQGVTFANDQWAQAQLNNTPTNKSVVHITACTSAAGTSTFTYTLTSGAVLFVGQQIYIAGMTNSGNNTTTGRLITGLGAGTFSVANASPGADESGSSGTGTGPGDCFLGLVVRGTANGQNGYFCYIGLNSGSVGNGGGASVDQRVYCQELWKNVNGTLTNLTTTFPFPTTIPDVAGTTYRLQVVGTTITLFRNGLSLISATDSDLTSGVPGIQASSTNGNGEFANPTNYNTGGDNSIQWTNFFAGDSASQLASDNFARGAGGLGTNWTTMTGATAPAIISSGVVEGPTVDNFNAALYNAVSFPNDQYAEVTIGAALANNQCYLAAQARMASGANTQYQASARGPLTSGNGAFLLLKYVAGVQSALTSYSTGSEVVTGQTLAVGDVIRIAVQGSTISLYQNGFLVIQGTDANIASGAGGFNVQPHTLEANARLSNWAGGAIISPTLPSSGGSSSWLTVANANALRGLKH